MATDPEVLWRTLESGADPAARHRALDELAERAEPGDRAFRRRLVELVPRLPDGLCLAVFRAVLLSEGRRLEGDGEGQAPGPPGTEEELRALIREPIDLAGLKRSGWTPGAGTGRRNQDFGPGDLSGPGAVRPATASPRPRRVGVGLLVGGAVAAALVWGVYRSKLGQVQVDERRERIRRQLDLATAAVQAFENRTGKTFTSSFLDGLVPQDLPKLPKDPWDQPYRFDPVLRRLICVGPDHTLDPVPRPGRTGTVPDDQVHFIDRRPPPMAVSFQDSAGRHQVAVLVPGATGLLPWHPPRTSGAPYRPAVAGSGSRLGYLVDEAQRAKPRAEWTRASPGGAGTWDEPVPLLPGGWGAESLTWLGGGTAVAVVAREPDAEARLYLVEPPGAPIPVAPGLREPRDPQGHPGEQRVVLTSLDPAGVRRVTLVDLAAEGSAPRFGPPAEQATFGPKGSSIWLVGPNPDKSEGTALMSWYEPDGPGYAGELQGSVLVASSQPLHVPVACPEAKRLAVVRGTSVVVIHPKNGRELEVFNAEGEIDTVLWPFPVAVPPE